MEEALRDIRNTGTMEAENKLSLKAGQDIDLASTLHKERNKQGYTQTIASSGKAAVTGNQGTLSMEAGRDIRMQAAAAILGRKYSHESRTGHNHGNRRSQRHGRHMGRE